jgi:hypothetical protein
MKQITHTAIGAMAAVLVLTGAVAARSSGTAQPPPLAATKPVASIPITLASRPGSPADRIAQRLMGRELAKSRRGGQNPLVLVGTAHLASNEVLFVQIQSSGDCGSAGCSTVSFKKIRGGWVRILDTVAGTIRVADSSHHGMPDLIVQDTERMVWDGSKYV